MENIDNYLSELDQFLAKIDSNTLFNQTEPSIFRTAREKTVRALKRLLVWHRPELEATRGIMWPYQALEKRQSFFENLANLPGNEPEKRESTLFLSLLPFPGQWRWLEKTVVEFGTDPEIRSFLTTETEKIASKLRKKDPRDFKPHCFCQVLKSPRKSEKGVLRIYAMPYLFANPELLKELNRDYLFYVEPAAGVSFRHAWLRAFSTPDDPTMIGAASAEDASFLGSQPNIVTTNLAHGDYLDDLIGVSPIVRKEFDIVFNGIFDDMPRKRHEFMLDLLNHPKLEHATALFLGRGEDPNIRSFEHMVREKRLDKRVSWKTNLKRDQVPDQLARCRIGVHLSLHENGCRAIYEFFRSDLPAVVSSSMGGLNMRIINSHTGQAVPDSLLSDAIGDVLRTCEEYSPRQWFLKHSGAQRSTEKLNTQLKNMCEQAGYAWTSDIVTLTSSGPGRYANQGDYPRFRSEFEKIGAILKRFYGYLKMD